MTTKEEMAQMAEGIFSEELISEMRSKVGLKLRVDDVLTWVTGKVTKKYMDEKGEYCVDVETHGINKRGEDVMPGKATVILPSVSRKQPEVIPKSNSD